MSDPHDPPRTGIELRHQAALARGDFLIGRCLACGKPHYFPRESCPFCGGAEVELVRPAGTGAVYSFTVVARRPEAGGDHNVVLVDLDEGVRLMSRLESVAPEALRIGQRVRTRVLVTEGAGIVVCDPVGGARDE